MLKRLAVVAAVSVGLTTLVIPPAGAAECNLVNSLLSTCAPPAPPAPSPPPSPAPSQPAPPPAPPAPPGAIAEDPMASDRIYRLLNEERARAGLPQLELRGQISAVAAGHSRAMASRHDIWHNGGYFTAGSRRALRARALGENVALNGSVDDAHRRLMASPGHRANILNGRFDAVGVAVFHDESGVFYVTQNFVDSAAAVTKAKKGKARPGARATRSRARRR